MNANDFFFEVSRGSRKGFTPVYAFGTNADVDAAEDIQSMGADRVTMDTETLEIVSDSVEDADGANGAITVLVEGLDVNLAYVSEVVELNGTTVVPLVAQDWRRVNSLRVLTGNSGANNVGVISIQRVSDNTVFLTIPAAAGRSSAAWYSVPAGSRLLITSVHFAVPGAGVITAAMVTEAIDHTADAGQPAQNVFPCVFSVGTSPYVHKFDVPFEIPGGMDVKLRALATSAASQVVTGGIVGVLLDSTAV